jgi:hypothetical protein
VPFMLGPFTGLPVFMDNAGLISGKVFDIPPRPVARYACSDSGDSSSSETSGSLSFSRSSSLKLSIASPFCCCSWIRRCLAQNVSYGTRARIKLRTYWAKLSDRENAFPHREQTYGRSWVWVRTCLLESEYMSNMGPNSLHELGLAN